MSSCPKINKSKKNATDSNPVNLNEEEEIAKMTGEDLTKEMIDLEVVENHMIVEMI